MATERTPGRAADLSAFRDRDDLTLDELVDAAEFLLRSIAPTQQKWKVSARPDARTVRYYVSEGLLPKPLGYVSGRARYGLVHLLPLLFIKKHQAEHETLRQIRGRLEGMSLAELEAALFVASPAPTAVRRRRPQPIVRRHSAAAPSALAASAPAAVLAGFAAVLQRALPGGAQLTVPTDSLEDKAARLALADALEGLALSLRANDESASETPASERVPQESEDEPR